MKKEMITHNSMKIHEVEIVYKRQIISEMTSINCSKDIDSFLRKTINLEAIDLKEFFWVILLSNSNNILGLSEIGKGDSSGVVVNIKEIFQLAITTNSTSLIICHNHPSGKLVPSEQDKKITKRVKDASQLFGMNLLDHIIITSEDYFSFADDGII